MILVGAALTDILLRLANASRSAAARRITRGKDDAIAERLREFEEAYEQATGERLSTAAFYDRFCAGEFDTRFGARWATYYEAMLTSPAHRDGLSHLGLHRTRPGGGSRSRLGRQALFAQLRIGVPGALRSRAGIWLQ
jgi:hypothetical protein